MVELRTLAYFVTTCRAESLTQAATMLDISVSTLSTTLKALADNLDLPLFRRSSNNLSPTPAARALMRAAEPLLIAELFARRHLAAQTDGELKRLTVDVDFAFAIGEVSNALRLAVDRMVGERPDVLVDIRWKDEVDQSRGEPSAAGATENRIRISLSETDRPRQKHEALLAADPWVFAFRLPAGTRQPADVAALTAGRIVVPMLGPSLIEQADRYFGLHKIKGVRFLHDHPGDLPRTIDDYPDAALFVPRSLISPRLGLSNVVTMAPEHALAMNVTANWSRSNAVVSSFIRHLKWAMAGGRSLCVESPVISRRQIHYFNLIHRVRRISAVARGAGISQPALSEQLHKLESALGKPLFERKGDGLVPTAEGERFAELSSLIDSGFQRLSASSVGSALLQSRRIVVGILPSVNEHGFLVNRIAEAIIDIQAKYPGLSLAVLEAPNGTLQDWVVGGLVNVAVVETILPHMPRLPLGSSESLAAIVHAKHRLLPPGPVKFVDLTQLKLILPTARFGLRQLFDDAARARNVRIRPFMEINALPMAASLLHRLPVCTVLPASAVKREIESGDLVAHPIVDPTISRRLYVIYSGERPLSEPERGLVKALRRKLSESSTK
jgi:LysR family transcriptional regulator, nitrogen assimilation regulatory protein